MRTSRRAFSYELAPEISGVVVSQYFCAHSHARLSVIKALTFFEPEHFKPKNGEHVRGVQFNCDLSATNSRMKIMKIISSSMSRSLRARAPRALCGPGICRLSRPPACFYCPRGPSCPPPPSPAHQDSTADHRRVHHRFPCCVVDELRARVPHLARRQLIRPAAPESMPTALRTSRKNAPTGQGTAPSAKNRITAS